MRACAQLLQPRRPAAPSAVPAGRAARTWRLGAVGGRQEARAAPPATEEVGESSSNIVPGGLSDGAARKLELERQAQEALAAENSWWQDDDDAPANLITAATPAAYKAAILGAPDGQLVVVDYLKPSCAACRRLFPKLKQIAACNPDALFIKVNVEAEEMAELGQGMQVTHLPWFHLFVGGDLVASFSANLHTVSQLRAEIAANKPCTDPGCEVY